MLSVSAQAPSFLHSHANVKQFSERLEQNHDLKAKIDQNTNNKKPESSIELSKQSQLQALKARDREVKAHELAHTNVGGQYASGASFTYEKGSDGVLYAVAGEVSINAAEVSGNPIATLEKAQVIQRAALAPANPSSQDRSVAASAAAMAQKARIDITKLQQIENIREARSSLPNSSAEPINVFA